MKEVAQILILGPLAALQLIAEILTNMGQGARELGEQNRKPPHK